MADARLEDGLIRAMRNYLSLVVRDMRAKMATGGASPHRNMNASGESRKQIRFDIKGGPNQIIGIIYGPEHMDALEKGRGPGRAPSMKAIREWIDHKGIIPKGDISKDSLAFLIQRSIKEKGTRMHQQNHRSGILSETLKRDRRLTFFAEAMDQGQLSIRSNLYPKLHAIDPQTP